MGRDCRGEEHEVELVFSKKSGKIKVYWNKSNITRMLRRRENDSGGNVDFAWEMRSGETLHVKSNKMSQSVVQYDLFVDGTNFFHMLSVRELGGATAKDERHLSDQVTGGSQRYLSLDTSTTSFPIADLPPPTNSSLTFRLSMAGLNLAASFGRFHDIQDELHSDLYSPVLESLRLQIINCLPQTEEMVSRAIINAFFSDTQSQESSSLGSSIVTDPYQVEADYVWEARAWLKSSGQLPDMEDLALQFLQKRIDDIILRIRNEELSSNEAARIVLSVAAVLGVAFATDIVHDTIMLDGLEKGTTKEELHLALSEYGEVEATSIARGSCAFGLCRFFHVYSTAQVMDAANTVSSVIGSAKPEIMMLRGNLFDGSHKFRFLLQDAGEQDFKDSTLECVRLTFPPVDRPRHHMGQVSSEDYGLFLGTAQTA